MDEKYDTFIVGDNHNPMTISLRENRENELQTGEKAVMELRPYAN